MILRILIVLFLARCATTIDDEKIMERSKSDAPSWLKMPINQFVKTPKRVQIYSVTDNEPDLPLGLKKAQSSALDTASKALDQLVQKDLKPTATQKPQEVSKQIFQRNLKIDDIYYEKMRTKNLDATLPEAVYRIHTLLGIERKDYDAAVN